MIRLATCKRMQNPLLTLAKPRQMIRAGVLLALASKITVIDLC